MNFIGIYIYILGANTRNTPRERWSKALQIIKFFSIFTQHFRCVLLLKKNVHWNPVMFGVCLPTAQTLRLRRRKRTDAHGNYFYWVVLPVRESVAHKNTLYNNTKQNPILSACQTLLHFNWNIDSEQTLPFNIIKYSHAILTATFISPQIYVSHVGFNAEKCYRRDSTGAKTIRINVRQEYQTRTMVI